MISNYTPALSCIYSLLLINGLYNLSFILSKKVAKLLKNNDLLFISILNFFVITSFLALITFYFSLFFSINIKFIKFTSFLIIAFGIYRPVYLKKFLILFQEDDFKIKIIYLILFSYFLLSLSPITDPDSLDYHVTIPQYIISYGDEQFSNHWLTSQLSGICETLLIYGLSIGALNFSQILQFFSLLFIILLILNFNFKKYKVSREKVLYVCLCILTIPTLIFLVSTSKPQLFPVAFNFIAIILTFFYLQHQRKKINLIYFALIIYILFITTQIKYSFFLSSGLITLLAIYELYKKKFLLEAIIISILGFTLIILPREIYEYLNFNPNIIYNFFNAHTDIFSSIEYNKTLKTNTGNSRIIPTWIFIPNSLSQITYSLGIGILYFLFLYNFKLNKKILIISTSYLIFGLILAQPVGRFFIEPFLWFLFFSIFNHKVHLKKLTKLFEKFLTYYSLIFLLVISFFSINLFKANFGSEIHKSVLRINADGYTLFEWANKVLPNDAILISTHRSHAFFKNKVISYEFRNFRSSYSKEGKEYYLRSIINQKPTHIIYTDQNLNNEIDFFKNCRGDLFAQKKNVYVKVGRNPFTKREKFDGYIFKLDLKQLENC